MNEEAGAPMQQQPGDQKREDVMIQIEDDGRSLVRDFTYQIGDAEKGNNHRQERAVFQPLAGPLALRGRNRNGFVFHTHRLHVPGI